MVQVIEPDIAKTFLPSFCRKNHIRRMSVFGSVATGQQRPDSDIDILVEFDCGHTPGLFDLSRMELELTAILGRKADLRTAEELSPYFRDEVISEASVQYEM